MAEDLRSQLLAHVGEHKTDIEPVPTPEWPDLDGKLGVCKLSADDADAWEFSLFDEVEGKLKRNMKNMRAKLVVRCLASVESGERICADGDTKQVGGLGSDAIGRLFEAARRHNGLAAGAEEVEEGNSESDPSDSDS